MSRNNSVKKKSDAQIDIVNIDNIVKETFNSELSNLQEYNSKLTDLKHTQTEYDSKLSTYAVKNLKDNIDDLEGKISDIENGKKLNFYISETIDLLEKYKNILQTPVKLSFTGPVVRNNKGKDEIVRKYIEITQKYINLSEILSNAGISSGTSLDKSSPSPPRVKKVVCNNCANKKDFDIIDNSVYICVICGSQQEILLHTSSYKDIDRVNISVKYTYDRKVHFRDGINQYQGKQNSTIHPKVLTDLEDQFDKHHLLLESDKREVRFKNVTKEHIHIFLKELGYTKHYENVNLIYSMLTGRKLDDISHLEDKLLNDFDILTDLYDKKFKNKVGYDRKSFINTQYVLYQLLMKYKHPGCKKENFTMLKTADRKSFHDDVLSELFTILEWPGFTPLI
jgi:hypothetical protein